MRSPMNERTHPRDPEASPRCHLIMPCAGSGSRSGSEGPKQYQPLAGQPMVLHTLAAFSNIPDLHTRLLVVAPDDATPLAVSANVTIVPCGGRSRAHSVFNGLQWLLQNGVAPGDWVLVHDAARCLLTPQQITTLIEACRSDPVGGLLALPLPDTLKASHAGRVAGTVDRTDKWLAQTPQMFRVGALHEAMLPHLDRDFAGVTDEASAMELAGHQPLLVPGSAQNFKVTYPEDFALAEAILRSRT